MKTEPLAKHDFLLISAREKPHDLPIASRFNPQQTHHSRRDFILRARLRNPRIMPRR